METQPSFEVVVTEEEPLGEQLLVGVSTPGMVGLSTADYPSHPPGPDFEAALRFIDAFERIFEFDIDEETLRERSEEMKRYYAELADRIESMQSQDQSLAGYVHPEDRMFM